MHDLLQTRHKLPGITILHVNIRSLPKNFDNLQVLVEKLKPQILLLSETWLDSSLSSSYKLTGYRLEISSQSETRGKGAAVYIVDCLPYSRRNDLESSISAFQSVFIEIKGLKSIILGSFYRSPSYPSAQFIDYLESTLDKINAESKICVFGGDFNIDLLKHETVDTCSEFLNSLTSYGFLPFISLPTRITCTSRTLIDNFFCNDSSVIKLSTVILSDISDHLPILTSIDTRANFEKKSLITTSSFDFRKIEALKQNISNKLTNFFDITDAEQSGTFLVNTIATEISNLSIKKVNRRTVPIQPWISFGLLQCINKKNKLHKKFVHHPSERNHTIFTQYRNILTNSIRSAKAQYYKRKLEEQKSDPKKLWQTLKEIVRKTKNREELPSHFEANNLTITKPEEIANQFNDFFSNIGPNLDALIADPTSNPESYLHNITPLAPFAFIPTSCNSVRHIINSLNNCGAGVDGISTKILKRISPVIIPHLTFLFNLCLAQGVYPSCFKKAIVVPIHKSGSHFVFNNYRPISILPVVSKILERIVSSQLSFYLTSENLINQHQFGFRQNHSTYMPVSLLYDEVTSALYNKRFCAALYLDFSKAFDTVNPSILLKKLKSYGLHNKSLEFFRSYLSDRCQVVKYNSLLSSSCNNMSLGVPQGSILGPLLFLIYINDIQNCCPSPQYFLFADDTALLYTAETPDQLQTTINNSLPKVATWLNCNRLTLNVKKSTYQLFSITSFLPDINIHINNNKINRSTSAKYLGVTIDEGLKWDNHIRQVENTLSRNIGLIRRAQYILDSCHLLLLYNAFILPFLTYCLQVWGSTYPSKLSRLTILQKKIIRIIDSADHRAHTSPIFKKYKVLKVSDLVKYVHICLLHNFLTNRLPPIVASRFTICQPNILRAVRTTQHFIVPFAPTNYRKFSLYIAAPATWNKNIANCIPDINDIPLNKSFFKKVVKKLFTDRY